MNEPVAHRFKWEEQEEWQYGDGYDATGAPNDPDYFAYEPLYTHPIRELIEDEIDANRYQWLRNEFANGRETYLAEGIPSGEQLDKYIDEQLKKASKKCLLDS